jgi:hypothetical protein
MSPGKQATSPIHDLPLVIMCFHVHSQISWNFHQFMPEVCCCLLFGLDEKPRLLYKGATSPAPLSKTMWSLTSLHEHNGLLQYLSASKINTIFCVPQAHSTRHTAPEMGPWTRNCNIASTRRACCIVSVYQTFKRIFPYWTCSEAIPQNGFWRSHVCWKFSTSLLLRKKLNWLCTASQLMHEGLDTLQWLSMLQEEEIMSYFCIL